MKTREVHKRSCEVARLAGLRGCPQDYRPASGRIIVVPHGRRNLFLYPGTASCQRHDNKIVTTHFDYHSIDHNLLKLDILGHDDPTMIRMLQDITGVTRPPSVWMIRKSCPYLTVWRPWTLVLKISGDGSWFTGCSGIWNRVCYADA